ncbi:MAG: hypothetical protein IT462_01085 [Planctomycetes bacterium]|nr:hypothetical protein [Planctomycetota bacterium]
MKAVTLRLGDGGLDVLLKRVREGQELGFEQFDLAIQSPQAALGRIVAALKQHNVKLCAVRLSEARQSAVVFRKPGYAKLAAPDAALSERSTQMVIETAEQLGPARPSFLILEGGFLDLPGLAERQQQVDEVLNSAEAGKACVAPQAAMKFSTAKADAQLEIFCRNLHTICRKLAPLKVCLIPPPSPFSLLTPERMQHVFEALAKDDLGYWHDTASANMLAKLGVAKADVWITKFSSRLKGVYLADALGAHGDQAPGLGEVDFKKIAPELASGTVRVLVVEDSSSTKLRFGHDHLSKVGIF